MIVLLGPVGRDAIPNFFRYVRDYLHQTLPEGRGAPMTLQHMLNIAQNVRLLLI